jgi:hypothetical protein
MHPPQGYFRLLQTGSRFNAPRVTKTSRKLVLRLRKSLYGRKKSSQGWYGTFKDFVISIGFLASRVDGGLFVLHDKEHHGIVVTASVSNGSELPGCSPGLEPDRMVQSGLLPGKQWYPPGSGTG